MFAMGLFFLMSGLVVPGALARRGPGGFARRRLACLGAPLLVWTLLIWPGVIWVAYRAAGSGESFGRFWHLRRANRDRRPSKPIDEHILIWLAVTISPANIAIRPFLPAAGDEILQIHFRRWSTPSSGRSFRASESRPSLTRSVRSTDGRSSAKNRLAAF